MPTCLLGCASAAAGLIKVCCLPLCCAVLRAVLCVVRALVFVSKFFGGMVPAPCDKGADKAAELGASVSERLQEYVAAMEKVNRVQLVRV